MAEVSFTQRQVEKSIRQFNQIVSDVLGSTNETWVYNLTRLMQFCDNDPVTAQVTAGFRTDRTIDVVQWHTDAINLSRYNQGHGISMPSDDQKRLSLLYQLFWKIAHKEFNAALISVNLFNATKIDDGMQKFNSQFIRPFTHSVVDLLENELMDIEEQNPSPNEASRVSHYHAPVSQNSGTTTNIGGSVVGSNLAIDHSSVVGSSADVTNEEDGVAAFESLRALLADVSEANRQAVDESVAYLIQAARTGDFKKSQIIAATETIEEHAPSIKQRLIEFATGTFAGLAATSLWQAIKLGLGMPLG